MRQGCKVNMCANKRLSRQVSGREAVTRRTRPEAVEQRVLPFRCACQPEACARGLSTSKAALSVSCRFTDMYLPCRCVCRSARCSDQKRSRCSPHQRSAPGHAAASAESLWVALHGHRTPSVAACHRCADTARVLRLDSKQEHGRGRA